MIRQHSLLLVLALITLSVGCSPRPLLPNLHLAPVADLEVRSSPNTSVLVYATKPAAFALRGGELTLRADTIRTLTPVRLTAYLNTGDIHIVAAGAVPIEVEATLANAPATRLSATGAEIVLYSGGTGVGPRR